MRINSQKAMDWWYQGKTLLRFWAVESSLDDSLMSFLKSQPFSHCYLLTWLTKHRRSCWALLVITKITLTKKRNHYLQTAWSGLCQSRVLMTQKLSDLHERRDLSWLSLVGCSCKIKVVSPVLRAEKTTSRSHVQTHMHIIIPEPNAFSRRF